MVSSEKVQPKTQENTINNEIKNSPKEEQIVEDTEGVRKKYGFVVKKKKKEEPVKPESPQVETPPEDPSPVVCKNCYLFSVLCLYIFIIMISLNLYN